MDIKDYDSVIELLSDETIHECMDLVISIASNRKSSNYLSAAVILYKLLQVTKTNQAFVFSHQ
jgi:hypothetical protein